MLGNIGFGELVLILLVLLLVFGTSKLPQLGDALGKGIRNFKKATSGEDAIDVTPQKLPPTSPTASAGTTPASAPAQQGAPSSETKR